MKMIRLSSVGALLILVLIQLIPANANLIIRYGQYHSEVVSANFLERDWESFVLWLGSHGIYHNTEFLDFSEATTDDISPFPIQFFIEFANVAQLGQIYRIPGLDKGDEHLTQIWELVKSLAPHHPKEQEGAIHINYPQDRVPWRQRFRSGASHKRDKEKSSSDLSANNNVIGMKKGKLRRKSHHSQSKDRGNDQYLKPCAYESLMETYSPPTTPYPHSSRFDRLRSGSDVSSADNHYTGFRDSTDSDSDVLSFSEVFYRV